MTTRTIFLFAAVLAIIINAELLSPRDLVDEVEEQLQELNSIIQGDIVQAHDNLDDDITDFTTYSKNEEENRGISLQQEQSRIEAQLSTVKELAEAAKVDITTCTNIREDALNRLPAQYTRDLNICINQIDDEARQIVSDAKYIIDVVINKVNQLEYQIRQCRGDILCLSPLVTEIELDKVRLPQNIQTEVQATETFLTNLRNLVSSCGSDKVYQYITTAYTILSDITNCVNKIIG